MRRRILLVALIGALVLPLAIARADDPRDPPPPRCEMGSCYDPLFTLQYPHARSFVTSSNVRVPLPFHFYDGTVVLIAGTGHLATMQAWTAGTPYRPVQTDDGTGVAGLVVLTWRDTDWGAYHEAFAVVAVNSEAVTVPATSGAMLAALLDPVNRIWLREVIIDAQLPLEVGREYAHMPKELDLKQMTTTIEPAYGPVSFEFAEQDGTPIAGASIDLELDSAPRATLGFASADGGQRLALDMAAGGNLHGRFVYPSVDDPDTLARVSAVGHTADPSDALIASCCAGSRMWFNPSTRFGSHFAALQMRPTGILTLKGVRFAGDIDL